MFHFVVDAHKMNFLVQLYMHPHYFNDEIMNNR